MAKPLTDDALRKLFLDARSHNRFTDRDIDETVLRQLIDVTKMGPTSANCSPARVVFVKSESAKQRLIPLLSQGNRDKTKSAPVCAIIGEDLAFYDHLGQLFPHIDARSWFFDADGEPLEAKIDETAFRNATLQGAYLMIAARALGLDCGPMSGFDSEGVTKEFFGGTRIRANFLCNLGYGDESALFERSPRFKFEEMASII
ncbi:MAG: malonic semialdehyde reductase [Pseudomonadota bacterium]